MSISVIFARALLADAQSRGFDPQALLARCHIDGTRLADLRNVMTLDEIDLLTRQAIDLSGDPGLGLTIGFSAPESMLQLLGQLVVTQSTIREAFATLQRYAALLDDAHTWSLLERGDAAMFACQPTFQLGTTTRCAMDFTLAMALRLGRHFLPSEAVIQRVHCQHAEPSYAQRYQDAFGCQVLFGQAENALVFAREYVDRPQFHADNTVHMELRRVAETLLAARTRNNLSQRVHTLLRHEGDLSDVQVLRVARKLGLSVRALRRRLSLEGTTVSALIDEARCRIARERLAQPELSIKETAELLGFSEASSFHRAFKRWTGDTAGRFRRTMVASA